MRARSKVRAIFPDLHGEHQDQDAVAAFMGDIETLDPDEVVGLGDLVDAGGTFSSHQRNYTNEMTESYDEDCNAAGRFLDKLQRRAPKARYHLLEGNHEQHIDRWAARNFLSHKDARKMVDHLAPQNVLDFKGRGISYYLRSEFYQGLSLPGTIKLGKCFFVHGISHSANCAQVHVRKFNANVVFGHVHTPQSITTRSVTSDGFGAWCPGTLAKLQPLWKHQEPTSWAHGYAVQFVAPSGRFIHVQVPIHKGRSMLLDVAARLA